MSRFPKFNDTNVWEQEYEQEQHQETKSII